MNELDQFFTKIGITSPDMRAEITAQAYAYGFELALSKIVADLSPAEHEIAEHILESGDLNDPGMSQLFGTDERIAILQDSLTEAFTAVAKAAAEEA